MCVYLCTVLADMEQLPVMRQYSVLTFSRHAMCLFPQVLCELWLTGCSLIQEEVLTLSVVTEIGIGFWLLVKMWYNPWSYVLQVYTYWKCSLPLRYAMPESAVYHKRVRTCQLQVMVQLSSMKLATLIGCMQC